MDTVMLYRYTVKNFGLFHALSSFWDNFSDSEKEQLRDILDVFDENLDNPPVKFVGRPYTNCWFTQKGYQQFSKYVEKLKPILHKYDLKITTHIRCVAPDDGSILYKDGNQMVVTDRVSGFENDDNDERERLYYED